MPEKPEDERPPEPPAEPPVAEREEHWRPRRPSPLGLMGVPETEVPKASPLPSARAAGIMVAFMAGAVVVLFLVSRACH